jgi:predicted DNA-binding transcriptional regulator AlpA
LKEPNMPAQLRKRLKMSKDKIRNSIENFVERITSGGASAEELSVLPGVLSVYCEFYRGNQVTDAPERMAGALSEPSAQSSNFPLEGLVGVKQVALFLSLSENTVWQKLRLDPEFPQPCLREARRTRWEASSVREHRRRTETS